MQFKYKEVHSFDERQRDSTKIKKKYQDRVPKSAGGQRLIWYNNTNTSAIRSGKVVVERHPKSQIEDIDKHKFLVPDDVTVAQLMWIIRKRINLSADKAIFLFVEQTMPQSTATIGQLYADYQDPDGFLYVSYSGENSFGSAC